MVVLVACGGGGGHSAAPTTTSTTAPTTAAPSVADVCAKAEQALAGTNQTLGNAAVREASALNTAGLLPPSFNPGFPFSLLNNPMAVGSWLAQVAGSCPALGH
jgi:hypothetical protein